MSFELASKKFIHDENILGKSSRRSFAKKRLECNINMICYYGEIYRDTSWKGYIDRKRVNVRFYA